MKLSAQLITIGTEITSGEVVNSNASWISLRLEELGIRVYSHLSVRDQREEIHQALNFAQHPLVIITGGLGPTSDDLTRECVAVYTKKPLDFDNDVWNALKALYEKRGLPLREAHRWQCHFPRGSERLKNDVGTALGFYQFVSGQHYFVLPGPPRELEDMWLNEVEPRLKSILTQSGLAETRTWQRWTCLGAPESEVAEVVEQVLKDHPGVEVGYRAQVPYVRVKVYTDPQIEKDLLVAIDSALKPWTVARGHEDLAEQLILEWPDPVLSICDSLTETGLAERLFKARQKLKRDSPTLHYSDKKLAGEPGLEVQAKGESFNVRSVFARGSLSESRTLPYKLPLNSERGKRSVTEWAIWMALCALRARASQP